ncbi:MULTISPECIES: DUF3967 domain-containing protein [Bacillales]|uniref:DUF3967 domain-containing protein n=1 Tax=Aneurinibacillus aneurinilyticus TaxID=1391 RepID=UPI00366D123A
MASVENRQQAQQKYFDTKLKQLDPRLIESIRNIQETKKEIAATQQKKWSRLWK